MKVKTELDALVEGELRLPRAIYVRILLGLHPTLIVIQRRLDHAVADRLKSGWEWEYILSFECY